MAHLTLKNAYSSLAERLNRFPQGAPPSELLFKILKMLFSEREADLVSMIPIKPFSVETASRIWKMDLVRSQAVLDKLAGRGILVDIEKNGKSTYVLPPPMAGFFEFSLMRTRDDIDQKVLSELFYEYLNVEEDFIKDLFTRGETQLGRTFVHEPVLSNENLLQEAYGNNLVQFGENVREKVNFICNCCGCCCEAMIAARRFAILNPVHTTNFLPVVTGSECNGCGKCVASCPVEAMTLVSSNNPAKPKMKTAELDGSRCLGCGVCVKACSKEALYLKSRPERVITPLNATHRTVVMAIERGKLQNLIFDNQLLWSHRAMAAVLGVILKLPPLKQALASQQVKSRYLETLVARVEVHSQKDPGLKRYEKGSLTFES